MRLIPALLLASIPFGAAARAELLDAVAVVVNGDIITLSELEERAGKALPPAGSSAELDKRRHNALKQIAEQLVAEKLVEAQAQENGLAPTEAEIDNAIEEVKRTNGGISDADFDNALKFQGFSRESYRKLLAGKLAQMKLVEMKVRSRVNITEDDVKARYAKIAGDVQAKPEVKLRDIIVGKEGDAEAARVKIEAGRARIAGGEKFADVAKELGGPLGASGGDFGWVHEGMLVPALEKLALAMKPGELSHVIEIDDNFHLLLVEDTRMFGGAKPISEAREEIRNQLYGERLEQATGDFISDLKRDAEVEYRLP